MPSHNVCYVPHSGHERPYRQYQVLTNPNKSYFAWQLSSNGEVPLTAVQGGTESDGQKLYIGRVSHRGSLVIGKVHPGRQLLYIPFAGSEIPIKNYEILVVSDKPYEDNYSVDQRSYQYGVRVYDLALDLDHDLDTDDIEEIDDSDFD